MPYAMEAKIYVVPRSHPCEAVLAAARHKGVPYRKVNLVPVQHKAQLLLTLGSATVPAMKYGGEKYHDSISIMRALESIAPRPSIFPADPAVRERVEHAVRWSDGDFQDIGRRLIWSQFKRQPRSMLAFSEGEKMPLPTGVSKPLLRPVAATAARYNRASDENVRDDLARLPELLDRVDELIADGTIGGDRPNVADFLIGASLGLWMMTAELRPCVENRPGGELADRLFPKYKEFSLADILPSEWFEPLRQAEAARTGQPA
jgi:glutathione S-transferase